MTPRRAALYLRVSTRDQTTENQERDLRRWADRLGFEIVRVYGETASGARGDRDGLSSLLAGAHRREFDVLLIWSLDRQSREGIGPMAGYMGQLRGSEIRVMSHQEPWLDTGGPVGDLLAAVFAWVAQQERQRIADRVRAGQARARAEGTHIGRRPRLVDVEEVRRRRAARQGWRRIARALKVPMTTLRRKATDTVK
jgi:DNA invertase Pin-like site-specific DNA recombinase